MVLLQVTTDFYKSISRTMDNTQISMFLCVLLILVTILLAVALYDRNRWKKKFREGDGLSKEDQKWIDEQVEATPEKLPEDENNLESSKVTNIDVRGVNKPYEEPKIDRDIFSHVVEPVIQPTTKSVDEVPLAEQVIVADWSKENLDPDEKELIDTYYSSEAVKDLKDK